MQDRGLTIVCFDPFLHLHFLPTETTAQRRMKDIWVSPRVGLGQSLGLHLSLDSGFHFRIFLMNPKDVGCGASLSSFWTIARFKMPLLMILTAQIRVLDIERSISVGT